MIKLLRKYSLKKNFYKSKKEENEEVLPTYNDK